MALTDPADVAAQYEMTGKGRADVLPTEWLEDLPDERVSMGTIEEPIDLTTEEARALTRGVVHPRKIAFILALAHVGTRANAARATGISLGTVSKWRSEDDNFRAGMDRAMEVAADVAEDEAYRRAVHGVVEPVYQQGRRVGSVRKFSDQLMMFLLRGAKPEKYMERVKHEVQVDVADRLMKARERALGRAKEETNE